MREESEVALHRRIQRLESDNERLRRELAFYETHGDAAGLVAEAYVWRAVSGRAAGSTKCDVVTGNRTALEVKFSGLHRTRTSGYRWDWTNIFGRDGCKDYRRLILVGETDIEFRTQYRRPVERYILFDLPRNVAVQLSTTGSSRRHRLTLNANPALAQSATRVLYEQYQITETDLAGRYGGGLADVTITVGARPDPR